MALVVIVRDALATLQNHPIQVNPFEELPGRWVVPARIGAVEQAALPLTKEKVEAELVLAVVCRDRSHLEVPHRELTERRELVAGERRFLIEVRHLRIELLPDLPRGVDLKRRGTVGGKVRREVLELANGEVIIVRVREEQVL